MSVNIQLPNITAEAPTEQIKQIKSYLHQLAQQLNWVLQTIASNVAVDECREMIKELQNRIEDLAYRVDAVQGQEGEQDGNE